MTWTRFANQRCLSKTEFLSFINARSPAVETASLRFNTFGNSLFETDLHLFETDLDLLKKDSDLHAVKQTAREGHVQSKGKSVTFTWSSEAVGDFGVISPVKCRRANPQLFRKYKFGNKLILQSFDQRRRRSVAVSTLNAHVTCCRGGIRSRGYCCLTTAGSGENEKVAVMSNNRRQGRISSVTVILGFVLHVCQQSCCLFRIHPRFTRLWWNVTGWKGSRCVRPTRTTFVGTETQKNVAICANARCDLRKKSASGNPACTSEWPLLAKQWKRRMQRFRSRSAEPPWPGTQLSTRF